MGERALQQFLQFGMQYGKDGQVAGKLIPVGIGIALGGLHHFIALPAGLCFHPAAQLIRFFDVFRILIAGGLSGGKYAVERQTGLGNGAGIGNSDVPFC